MKKSHQEIPQFDANRRRLTKAGLAAPAVLGTLASKQVLGAPYYCTVSGQVSGNTSAHGPDNGCSISGALSPTSWTTANSWPIDKAKTFNGLTNGSVTFPNIFYKKHYGNGSNCAGDRLVSSGNSNAAATLPEVLTLAPSTCDTAPTQALLDLARAAIATVLNAANLGTEFPVDQGTAMAMFNAVYSGGVYVDPDWLNKHASWDASDVYCYFRLLYGGVIGCGGLTT
jgi:hypothetical protein